MTPATSNKWISFNTNEYIRVKLNERGWVLLLERYARTAEHFATTVEGLVNRLYPLGDDGFRKMQMWEFAQILGPHFGLGKELPCDIVIQIDREALRE